MDVEVNLLKISPLVSVGCCLLLAILYVASLYVWTFEHNRDHPSTVKKRFFSVFIVMLISPFFMYIFSSKELFDKVSLWEAMGFRRNGLPMAICVPLFHTILLFAGPVTLQLLNGASRLYLDPRSWVGSCGNLLWLRNHIVAPFSEEFTFRACMMPLLLQSFTPLKAVFITPLFFGVAHFHHMFERLKNGMELKTVIIISCTLLLFYRYPCKEQAHYIQEICRRKGFQFTYTTIFGFYSSYLFARTGHFAAPFVAHAFCNHMGFPDIQELLQQKEFKRKILICLYILGVVSWIVLMPVLTQPSWYSNDLYWHTR